MRLVKLPSGLLVPHRPGVLKPNRVAGLSRRAFLGGLGAAIITKPAKADFLLNSYAYGVAVTPIDVSFTGSFVDGSDLTTYTFAACDYGVADANRWVVIVAHNRGSALRTFSSGTA